MLRRSLMRLAPNRGNVRHSAHSDYYDPRVVYGKEPWNNPLKETTGLAGLAVDHKWRRKLITLYTSILDEARMIPESTAYRQIVENIYREFLRVVSNVGDNDWRTVERKIGLGQVEQLIHLAMDERELVQAYAEWKLWLVPIETVREVQEEAKIDMYTNFVGPPEPYLSDDEINDLKKIDQQRMAEEQKLLAQDVKKLAGRTSRMVMEDMEERTEKRRQYEEAMQEYIRETQLDRSYMLRADGTVKSAFGQARGEEEFRFADERIASATNTTSFERSGERKQAAFADVHESVFHSRPSQSQVDTELSRHQGAPGLAPKPGGKTNLDPEGFLPNRITMYSVKSDGLIDDVPDDIPRGSVAAKAGRGGRLIPKWRKPGDTSARGQEVPAALPKDAEGVVIPGARKFTDE